MASNGFFVFLFLYSRRVAKAHKPNSGSQIHNSPSQPTKSLNCESQSHPLSLRRRPAAWRCGRGGARAAGGPAARPARRGARVAGRPADLHDASAERGGARLPGPHVALEHGEPPSRAAREQPSRQASCSSQHASGKQPASQQADRARQPVSQQRSNRRLEATAG